MEQFIQHLTDHCNEIEAVIANLNRRIRALEVEKVDLETAIQSMEENKENTGADSYDFIELLRSQLRSLVEDLDYCNRTVIGVMEQREQLVKIGMEFGGPPPPMDNTYFQSTLSEGIWKQIEDNRVNYTDNLKGWKKILEQEKAQIEMQMARKAAALARWMDETDYAIRMLRCVEEPELAQHYIDQSNQQKRYMDKVVMRRNLLEVKINEILKHMMKPSNGNTQN